MPMTKSFWEVGPGGRSLHPYPSSWGSAHFLLPPHSAGNTLWQVSRLRLFYYSGYRHTSTIGQNYDVI